MDIRDVIMCIMGICIIALAYALFFYAIPSELIIADDIADDIAVDILEPLEMWRVITGTIVLIVMFLYLYFSWHFSVG